MLNFAVGPVQMEDDILKIGANQIPYFRTDEFSKIMRNNELYIKRCMSASDNSRALFLTGSGTAAMEAAVQNLFTERDKLLVINGGSFGKRFAKICEIHQISHTELMLETGVPLTENDLFPYYNQGYTGFLINILETSTGVHYDLDLVSRFCKENRCLLVVDAVSSFLADPFYMERQGVDVVLTGSQKGLALPPGISILVLNERSLERIQHNQVKSLYFNLKDYLKDGERGQTPFTPAVSILIQMEKRLKEIIQKGIDAEWCRIRKIAVDFRTGLAYHELPFAITTTALSNAVTPLHPLNVSAYQIFSVLKDEYDIFVCPNGGDLEETLFRVGHLGNLTIEDNQTLLTALKDMENRGLL